MYVYIYIVVAIVYPAWEQKLYISLRNVCKCVHFFFSSFKSITSPALLYISPSLLFLNN